MEVYSVFNLLLNDDIVTLVIIKKYNFLVFEDFELYFINFFSEVNFNDKTFEMTFACCESSVYNYFNFFKNNFIVETPILNKTFVFNCFFSHFFSVVYIF